MVTRSPVALGLWQLRMGWQRSVWQTRPACPVAAEKQRGKKQRREFNVSSKVEIFQEALGPLKDPSLLCQAKGVLQILSRWLEKQGAT